MKILYAEDEVELSDAVTMLLKRNGYSVDCVYDGKEALDYLENMKYDVIILDIMMPKVDGLTVLKTLRKNQISTPVLILTAKSQTDDVVTGLDLGADDYLTKPFNFKILLARIRALTRREGIVQDETLTFGDLSLNHATAQVIVNGNSAKLVNKEMQILEVLLKNQDRITSIDSLLNSAWSTEDYSTEENLYVFISYLRRKLKQLESKVEIKAYRNQGYGLIYNK